LQKISNDEHLCVLFSLIYGILRILNPEYSRDDVVAQLLRIVETNKEYVLKFGTYVQKLIPRIPAKYLKQKDNEMLFASSDQGSEYLVGASAHVNGKGNTVYIASDREYPKFQQIDDDTRLAPGIRIFKVEVEKGVMYAFCTEGGLCKQTKGFLRSPFPPEYDQLLHLDEQGKSYALRLSNQAKDYDVQVVKNAQTIGDDLKFFTRDNVVYYCDVSGNPCQTWDPRTWSGWSQMGVRRAQRKMKRLLNVRG